jgi:MFS family permease
MLLWSGETISVFGSMIGIAAMSFTAILFLHATPLQMGILTAARLVPTFMMSLIAGVWVDRLHKKPILIFGDIGRAILLATIPLAAYMNLLRIEQLYIVAFLMSILTIFFNVAYQSFLPSLLNKEDLIEGNSKLSASPAVSEVSGFSFGGWLVQFFTGPITILIDAISFICSAILVSRISTIEIKASVLSRKNLRIEIKEGVKELLQNPILKTFALCTFHVRNVNRSFQCIGSALYEPGARI